MLYGFFGLGLQELIVLGVLGLMLLVPVVVVLIVIKKSSMTPKIDEERDFDERQKN